MIPKLITSEDPGHIHKTCGIIVLFNFCYQLYLFTLYDEMNLNLFILAPHILLHVTSFVFNVLSKRPKQKKLNMFIWNELRIHSFIFALRSIVIILVPNTAKSVVAVTLLGADVTTYFYGSPNVSTVRGYQPNSHKRKVTQHLSAVFFSSSQLCATLICSGCFQNGVSKELVFLTLPPIQTSAFGMTLLRKNIISKSTWSMVYSMELLIVYLAWFKVYRNIHIVWYSILLYCCRKYICNKYILWASVFVLDAVTCHSEFMF